MAGIIILVVVLAVVGVATYGIFTIKRKVEEVSRAAFGTSDLAEGLRMQADELATTPKSVSGMTRLLEPQITKDFPEFNWVQFKNKAENMLVSAFGAITAENAKHMTDVSEEVKSQIKNQILENQNQNIKETYSRVRIHQTEIANYVKKQGKCIITLQSALEYLHYREQNGKVIEGNKERLIQTKYNTELMYIQDEKLANESQAVGAVCPNCGAPITNLGSKYCEYCGLAVTTINLKVWSLHKFYEVDYKHI